MLYLVQIEFPFYDKIAKRHTRKTRLVDIWATDGVEAMERVFARLRDAESIVDFFPA